jgi:hypothetical protein
MEAVMGVLLIVGIVIWAFARNATVGERTVGQRPVTTPRPAPVPGPSVVHPARPVLTEPASHPDDGAFFDGYIWGRLQERHDEQQHGASGAYDHGMFDGDDGCDHHG